VFDQTLRITTVRHIANLYKQCVDLIHFGCFSVKCDVNVNCVIRMWCWVRRQGRTMNGAIILSHSSKVAATTLSRY